MPPRFIALALAALLFLLSTAGTRIIYRNGSQDIFMRPLMLLPGNPARNTVGELEFLNAWELGSRNSDFGGLSALARLPDDRFIAVSDAGSLIGFGLTQDNRIDRPFIAAMPGAFGPNVDYEDRDSEGLAYDPGTRRFWVSYEGHHAIRRFAPSFARIDGKATAKEMKIWGGNSGGEALVRLPDGRFILFSEGMDRADGSYEALLFSGDPAEAGTRHFSFGYRPPPGYRPTDAAMLPDGRLLLLNRRLGFPNGFAAKLVTIDPGRVAPNVTLRGRVIAALAAPLLVDNMEGITIGEENGRVIVWMISDNNFNIWQRTILMKFALIYPAQNGDAKKPAADNIPGFDSL